MRPIFESGQNQIFKGFTGFVLGFGPMGWLITSISKVEETNILLKKHWFQRIQIRLWSFYWIILKFNIYENNQEFAALQIRTWEGTGSLNQVRSTLLYYHISPVPRGCLEVSLEAHARQVKEHVKLNVWVILAKHDENFDLVGLIQIIIYDEKKVWFIY